MQGHRRSRSWWPSCPEGSQATGNVEDALGYRRDDAFCKFTVRFLTTIK